MINAMMPHLSSIPRTEEIQTVSDQSGPEPAPRYVVQPASFTGGGSQWLRDNNSIIDFGISFLADDTPKDLGIPPRFTAPEAWFEMAAGKITDLWALGCTLYTLRSGVTLIQLFWGGTSLEVISGTCSFLGPLQERWDLLWFDEEGMPQSLEEMAGNESSPQWCNGVEEQPQSLQDLVMHITDEYHGLARAIDNVEREKLPIELEIEAKGGKVMYSPEKPKQPISSARDLGEASMVPNRLPRCADGRRCTPFSTLVIV